MAVLVRLLVVLARQLLHVHMQGEAVLSSKAQKIVHCISCLVWKKLNPC